MLAATSPADDPILIRVADRALELVRPHTVIGLGTGRAATAFVHRLGARVHDGLDVRGVPTSEVTAALARRLGIPLARLEDADTLDLTCDGADEVDPALNLIKGYGGALVREKIVAAASRQEIILVGEEKLVPVLGSHGKLPVEVIPFAEAFCRRRLIALGLRPVQRHHEEQPFVTDSGNHILDCGTDAIQDPAGLEAALRAIPGVVGTGLFVGLAHRVLVGTKDGVRELVRPTT